MFFSGTLHGIEASFLSQSALLKLQSVLDAAVWSKNSRWLMVVPC